MHKKGYPVGEDLIPNNAYLLRILLDKFPSIERILQKVRMSKILGDSHLKM
jgi:hypothetical protein